MGQSIAKRHGSVPSFDNGLAALVLALSIVVGALPASAQTVPKSRSEITLSFAPIVKRVAPAVVNIYTKTVVERRLSPFAGDPFFERFFGTMPGPDLSRRRMESSLGSGVIVAPSGLLVTAEHVVRNAVEITAVLPDRREFAAEILLADPRSDLAILRLIEASELPTVSFGDSDALEVGDLVLAIGNPFGVGQTVTSGILSAQARSGQARAGQGGQTYLQTDAAINPGNSGGALVDMAGRLVGINSAILTRSGGSNGIGFAVPSALVRTAVEQAEAGAERLTRPWLGVETQSVDYAIAEALGLRRPEGVLIRRLSPQSPLAEEGMREGEVILEVDGEPIDDRSALDFRLAAKGVGDRVRLTVLGLDGERAVRMTLIAPPEVPPRAVSEIRRGDLAGLRVANLNPALGREMGLDGGWDGVVVLSTDDTPRWLRRAIRPGDILRSYNGRSVSTNADLRALIEAQPALRRLDIDRDGRLITLQFGR